MKTSYFALLAVALVSLVGGALFLVLGTVKRKKWFFEKKGGRIVYAIFLCATLSFVGVGVRYAIPAFGDLPYALGDRYEEAVGLVMGFDEARYDADGNGRVNYSRPIVYLEETGETLVLHTKDLSLGKRYLVRYYPHTRIAEAVKELPRTE